MNVDTLTTFFGWMSVITVLLLVVTTPAMILARDWISAIHGRMFGLDEHTLRLAYFQYLSGFKIVVTIFCVAPYIALKLMS